MCLGIQVSLTNCISCVSLHRSRFLPSVSPEAEQQLPWPEEILPLLLLRGQLAEQPAGLHGHIWQAGLDDKVPSWHWLNDDLLPPDPELLPGLQRKKSCCINIQWNRKLEAWIRCPMKWHCRILLLKKLFQVVESTSAVYDWITAVQTHRVIQLLPVSFAYYSNSG